MPYTVDSAFTRVRRAAVQFSTGNGFSSLLLQ